jgi:hypothetical protein
MRFPLSVGSSRYFYLHMIQISVHHLPYHAELNSKNQTVRPDCDARSKRCRPDKTLDSWTKGDADKAAGLPEQISAQTGRSRPWRSKPSGIPTGETFDIVGAGDGLTNAYVTVARRPGLRCGWRHLQGQRGLILRHLLIVGCSRHAGRRDELGGSRTQRHGDAGSGTLDLGDDAGRIRGSFLELPGLAKESRSGRLNAHYA